MLLWLIAVTVPVAIAALVIVGFIDQRFGDRVESDLASVHRLEMARVDERLDAYERQAESLAAGDHVRDFTNGVRLGRLGELPAGQVVGDRDGFDAVDPADEAPLAQLAQRLRGKALTTGTDILDVRLYDLDGSILGTTPGFSAADSFALASRAMDAGATLFGPAFRSADDSARITMATPILAPESSMVIGAVVTESELGPIVDLVLAHEGFGETSEAHMAQPTADGDAEFITLLRFARDAAFNKVVPAEMGFPINQSLLSPVPTVVRSPDYRQEMSFLAIGTVERTGWGVVVKIDEAEALAPVATVRQVVLIAFLLSIAAIAIAWTFMIRPIGRRLRQTADSAREVQSGSHGAINDSSTDEIGELAKTIDELAADLALDNAIRVATEERLAHQASHDPLTGLFNRQHAEHVAMRLIRPGTDQEASVLFVDLDGFRVINDLHGHSVGDEVLVAVARRLESSVETDVTVARWGADEFVLLMPDTPAPEARLTAARLEKIVEAEIDTSVGPQRAQCSVGTASSGAHPTAGDCLRAADLDMNARKSGSASVTTIKEELQQ